MARKGRTKQDWLEMGQTVLREGGIEALKLHSLTERMAVSTGSFYHHFKNFEDYLTTLADYYGSEQAQVFFDECSHDEPAELLKEATRRFGEGSGRQLNIAMRAWAQMDKRAFAAVRRYDETLMNNLDAIFEALGYDELAAKSRTLILMGLASLDIDQELLAPDFTTRWLFIRDQMVLPQEEK